MTSVEHKRWPRRKRLAATGVLVGMALVQADPSAAINRPAATLQPVAVEARITASTQVTPAWWQSLNDPLLDRLVQGAIDAENPQADAEAAVRVVTLYLEARWLTAKLALARDLTQVSAQRRRWAASQGPTDAAARAITQLDQSIAEMTAEVQRIAVRLQQHMTALRAMPGFSVGDEADMSQSVQMPTPSLASFGAGHGSAGMAVTRDAFDLERQAMEVRQVEQVALDYTQRFEAQRRAFDAGNGSERAVLQAFEHMLLAADQALQAEVAWAMAWVRAWAHTERAATIP